MNYRPLPLVAFSIILLLATGPGLSCGGELRAGSPPGSEDPHLLVTYSWGVPGRSNIGDTAIAVGFFNLLRERESRLPVVAITYQRADDSAFEGMHGYLEQYLPDLQATLPFPFVDLVRASADDPGRPGSAWNAFHRRWGTSTLRAFENGTLDAETAARVADDVLNRFPLEVVEELESTDPDGARAFRDAGFVMYTPGMVLNFGRSGIRNFYSYTLRNAMSMILARALDIPYGVNAHSFEAIDWPSSLVMRPLLEDAEFVYCRDPDSITFLEQQCVTLEQTGFRPDTTFFVERFDEPWADEFLREHGLEAGNFISVLTRSGHSRGGLVARTVSAEREQAHMATIRGFIEDWIERTGVPVVICPEVRSEIPWVREYVYERLSPEARRRCVLIEDFWTTEQAYSFYKRTELVVSMEMHSVIMALGLGTPALLPEFTENGRKGTMLGEMGLGDWRIDIDAPDSRERLLETALAIHRDRGAAEERIHSELPRLRGLGLDVIAEIETFFED